jgi:hypothetical protein
MSSWWEEDCPARGGALSHAHWQQCDPASVHPHDGTGSEGHKHLALMCCHCEKTEETYKNEAAMLAQAEAAMKGATPPLALLGGANGKCLFHVGFKPHRIVGEAGERWALCPGCDAPLEPREATGTPTGKPSGPGRGALTSRQIEKLNMVAEREKFYLWLEAAGRA